MAERWETYLDRWGNAGLIGPGDIERVRNFEHAAGQQHGLRWPVIVAVAFGALLLAAGVLLFVAAHWDDFSPAGRFAQVLIALAALHIAGALAAEEFPGLSIALHAAGTVALGGGIFISGQIFNLEEHWPSGILLWALGALIGWIALRDWAQAVLLAILVPSWLYSEWSEATPHLSEAAHIMSASVALLSLTYLSALTARQGNLSRKALAWVGNVGVLPAAAAIVATGGWFYSPASLSESQRYIGWVAGLGLPLAAAWALRGRDAWMNAVAAAWVVALAVASMPVAGSGLGARIGPGQTLLQYGLCALGAVGLVAWGLREGRKERINLGMAGFGLTVLAFYFSSVMDRLGRSASLIGLGLLFLLGGWQIEKARRRLVARIAPGVAP